MQVYKMFPIEGYKNSIFVGRECQNLVIRDTLVRFPGIVCGKYIMSPFPEQFDDGFWEIFIGIQAGHNHAFSFSSISRSISSRWRRAYPHALLRSSARNPG